MEGTVSLRIRIALLSIAVTVALPLTAHAGGGAAPQARDTIGLFRQGNGFWILRSSNSSTCTTAVIRQFFFGASGDTDTGLKVDLDGDGVDQVTVFRDGGGYGSFFIRANNDSGPQSATRINFGAADDLPVAGNFDGTGGDELGVFRSGVFFLRLSGGTVRIPFGDANDLPIAGNWDGSTDGSDEIGLFRPSTGQFFLRANNDPGNQPVTVRGLGTDGDQPSGGDFDADGTGTIAVYRETPANGGRAYFNNLTTGGGATDQLPFGIGTEDAVFGDWDGAATDEDGC
jgi:hypothetical protein